MKYQEPQMEIIRIESTSIITESNLYDTEVGGNQGGTGWGNL